ncbi:hypothetical protein Anapl_03540 [Anas platyrhynchos]|uniref:Uncharacterized protein n=1 Tax=Anas platyrhynchos TaxID=8839 RepID=R0LYZ1_ANAPL|nr:hypothetical protein Anapl_03540 [Anas platyrhynchos]
MLQQAKKRGDYAFSQESKEVMGVTSALFGAGESLEQEILWNVPGETYRNKSYKVSSWNRVLWLERKQQIMVRKEEYVVVLAFRENFIPLHQNLSADTNNHDVSKCRRSALCIRVSAAEQAIHSVHNKCSQRRTRCSLKEQTVKPSSGQTQSQAPSGRLLLELEACNRTFYSAKALPPPQQSLQTHINAKPSQAVAPLQDQEEHKSKQEPKHPQTGRRWKPFLPALGCTEPAARTRDNRKCPLQRLTVNAKGSVSTSFYKCCGMQELLSLSCFFLQGVPHQTGNKPLPGDPEESLQQPCFSWSVDGTEKILQTSGAGLVFVSLQQLMCNSVCHTCSGDAAYHLLALRSRKLTLWSFSGLSSGVLSVQKGAAVTISNLVSVLQKEKAAKKFFTSLTKPCLKITRRMEEMGTVHHHFVCSGEESLAYAQKECDNLFSYRYTGTVFDNCRREK